MKETSMVRVISGEDVKEILAGKEKQVIYIVEEAFKKRLKGSVMLPDKIDSRRKGKWSEMDFGVSTKSK